MNLKLTKWEGIYLYDALELEIEMMEECLNDPKEKDQDIKEIYKYDLPIACAILKRLYRYALPKPDGDGR